MDEHMLKRPETVYVHILKGNKFMKLQGETNKYLEEDIGLNGVVRKSRMHKPAIDTWDRAMKLKMSVVRWWKTIKFTKHENKFYHAQNTQTLHYQS